MSDYIFLFNALVFLLLVLVFWFILRLILKKLIEPHRVSIYGPTINGTLPARPIAYLTTPRKASGYNSILIDEALQDNKEVAEIDIIEDTNSVYFKNLLLIDTSGSTDTYMNDYKLALKNFVNGAGANEEIALYTFSDTCELKCDFTNSISALTNAIDGLTASGQTALNDSILAAVSQIEAMRVIERSNYRSTIYNVILFTDGFDNLSQATITQVTESLKSKSIFIICTHDADLPLMHEWAKNPKNVFPIGVPTTANSTSSNNLINQAVSNLDEALTKIRKEKLIGRGTVGYIQLWPEDGTRKKVIRGYVNALGEIYSCGANGEGAQFIGLCDETSNLAARIFIGAYINPNVNAENYNLSVPLKFGSNVANLPIKPAALAAGGMVVYKLHPKNVSKVRPENIINAFPKVAFYTFLCWAPVFLLFWISKYLFGTSFNYLLGTEFDTTIVQLMVFFVFWFIISSLYVDSLRKNKRFLFFNDSINNIIGSARLSTIVLSLSAIGIVGSLFLFYPFSYLSFFIALVIVFSANRQLYHGGGKTWPIDLSDPPYLPEFSGNMDAERTVIKFEYAGSDGRVDSAEYTVRVKRPTENISFKSFYDAVIDANSMNLVCYIEQCNHITSLVKNYSGLTEYLMAAASCEFNDKSLQSFSEYHSPNQIIFLQSVSAIDKMVFTSAILMQGGAELIIQESPVPYIGVRTLEQKSYSPYIFEWDKRNYYLFGYAEEEKKFVLVHPAAELNMNWQHL